VPYLKYLHHDNIQLLGLAISAGYSTEIMAVDLLVLLTESERELLDGSFPDSLPRSNYTLAKKLVNDKFLQIVLIQIDGLGQSVAVLGWKIS